MKIRARVLTTLLCLIFSFFISEVYAEEPVIDAPSYILIEAKTGQVLIEKNSKSKVYPASTTKILTAILALELGKPDQVMIASKAAVADIGKDGMNIGIMAGEEMKMKDLINVMLIKSANETANILAENLAPTRESFIALMNKKAQEIGTTGSNFVNTNGMHNPDHYTTVSDLSKIASYAMKIPAFREIVLKKEYATLEPTNKHSKWPVLATTNKLLLYTKYQSEYYTQITGIKTGSTGEAGNCLISSAVNKDGIELISVITGVKSPIVDSVFAFSKTLLEYGFANYSLKEFVQKDIVYISVPVEGSVNATKLDLVTDRSLSLMLPKDGSLWGITSHETLSLTIEAPVKKGDVLGYVDYVMNSQVIGRVNLIASNDVEKKITEIIVEKVQESFKNRISIVYYAIPAIVLILFYIYIRVILRKKIRKIRKT